MIRSTTLLTNTTAEPNRRLITPRMRSNLCQRASTHQHALSSSTRCWEEDARSLQQGRKGEGRH